MIALKNDTNYISEKLNEDKEIDLEREKEFIEYINELQNDDDGNISILKKFSRSKSQRWSINVNDKLEVCKLAEEKDLYLSVNSFYVKGKHDGKYIKKLNALMVDLDYYNVEHLKGLSENQVIHLLEQDLNYPMPSYYIGSGKGIYIIWLLNETYATPSSKKYWRKLEETLIDLFKDFGADEKVKDEARVLRKIGSVNSSSNKKVRILQKNRILDGTIVRYEMGDIADYFWGFRDYATKPKTSKKKKEKQECKFTQLKNIHTLNYSRYRDMEILVDLRKNSGEIGYRESLLFIYRLYLLYFGKEDDEALDMTLKLNNKLCIPLSENEVINSTKSATKASDNYHRLTQGYKEEYGLTLKNHLQNNGAYIYSNNTIIRMLNITEEEQRHLLITLGPVVRKERKDVRNKVYYEENKEVLNEKNKIYYEENKKILNEKKKEKYNENLKKENKLTREEKKKKTEQNIKELLNKGYTQNKIAEALELGIATVKRYAKAIQGQC